MGDFTVEERKRAEEYWTLHPALTYLQCLKIVAEDNY